MLLHGIDIPLVEIIFLVGVIIIIVLAEAIFMILFLSSHLKRTHKLVELIGNLSQTLLQIKKAEIEELDKLKK